jgi:iron(III) transport system permease protein
LATPWHRWAATHALRSWDLTKLVWVSLALVLIVLVANPLLSLFMVSVADATGGLTLGNYVEAFSRPRYLVGFRNSLLLGSSVACLCLLFAVPMAWGVSRTNMLGKALVQILVLCTFVTPPFSARRAGSCWLDRTQAG